jgi:hypothetical protein
MFDRFPIETGIEEAAPSHGAAPGQDCHDAAASLASVDTAFDTTSVSPALAPVDTGFGDLGAWLEHEIDELIDAKAAEREPRA